MFCVVIMSSTKGDGVATIDLLTMRLKLFTPDFACSTLPCSAFCKLCLVCALAAYFSYSYRQSVTSRLETSRYRDFSQFFESIGLGLENFGIEKKSRYRSRKYLVSKKSLGIGLENI